MDEYTLWYTTTLGGSWETHETNLDNESVMLQGMELLTEGKAVEIRIGIT